MRSSDSVLRRKMFVEVKRIINLELREIFIIRSRQLEPPGWDQSEIIKSF